MAGNIVAADLGGGVAQLSVVALGLMQVFAYQCTGLEGDFFEIVLPADRFDTYQVTTQFVQVGANAIKSVQPIFGSTNFHSFYVQLSAPAEVDDRIWVTATTVGSFRVL